MAMFIFTKKIISDEPISVFNNGDMKRDFTYIDDTVNGVVACTFEPPKPNKMAVVIVGNKYLIKKKLENLQSNTDGMKYNFKNASNTIN